MKTSEIEVIIKDINNNQILNKYQIAKIISSIKSNINPDCKSQVLNYNIRGDHVFIHQNDLIVLKVKLNHFHEYTLVETPA